MSTQGLGRLDAPMMEKQMEKTRFLKTCDESPTEKSAPKRCLLNAPGPDEL